MTSNDRRIAFFKHRSINSQPFRPGAVQIKRNCPRCIIKQEYRTDKDFDTLLTMSSFDNLKARRGAMFSRYHSVQYHIGQTELLKYSLKETFPTIYIVGVTDHEDLSFFDTVMKHVSLPASQYLSPSISGEDLINTLKKSGSNNISLAIPIQVRSCASSNRFLSRVEKPCFRSLAVREILRPSVDFATREPSFDLNIVVVSIAKEHDDYQFYGLGSISIQLSEAFSLQSYIGRLCLEDKTTHLVQHLCFDISRISATFAPNLIAYVMLYMEKDDGLGLEDLITTINWFRKTSLDTDIQIGFTGDTQYVVEFGLIILRDYFHYEKKLSVFRVKVPEKLQEYAIPIIPRVAFYGIISRAILIEYKEYTRDETIVTLSLQLKVRVMKDNVINISRRYAESIERFFPCRRPCTTIEQALTDTFTQMNQFGKYFKVEEPQTVSSKNCPWAGDSDSDDEYYYRNRDNPSLKTWLVLTRRQYRLDRMNMFINAIDDFLLEDE